jgi:hypothetical protein
MSAEQKKKIAESVKRKIAEKKATEQTEAPKAEPVTAQAYGVETEIAAPMKPLTGGLLDKVKQGLKIKPQGNTEQTMKVSSENLIVNFVPVAAGFLAYKAGDLWADEYQPCAPTKAEVTAVLKPIACMVSRRLEFSFEETPDIRDIRMSATALIIYILRAATTSMEIHDKLESERAVGYAEQFFTKNHYGQTGNGQTSAQSGYTSRGTDKSAGTRDSGNVSGPQSRELYGVEHAISGNGPETDAEYARRTIAEAFKQDVQYRTQYGLL